MREILITLAVSFGIGVLVVGAMLIGCIMWGER